jgi:hypothetical protein
MEGRYGSSAQCDTGAHCAQVSGFSGGCRTHLEGTSESTAHILGFAVHEATCTTEFLIRLDEDGNASDQVTLTVSACVDPAEDSFSCQGDLQLVFATGQEDSLTAQTTTTQSLGVCEIDFSGSVETFIGSDDPHITHL